MDQVQVQVIHQRQPPMFLLLAFQLIQWQQPRGLYQLDLTHPWLAIPDIPAMSMKPQCNQVYKEAILRTIILKDLPMIPSAVEIHPLDMLIARHLYKTLDMLWTTGRRLPDMVMTVPTRLLHLEVMLLLHIEDSPLHMIQFQAETLTVDAQDLHKILMQGNAEDSRDDVSSMSVQLPLLYPRGC